MTMNDLKKQLEEYRTQMKAKPGAQVYTASQEIIFIEGIAAHLDALCKQDVGVKAAIEAANTSKSLIGCAKHCMERARKSIGGHGDLPAEDMAMLIWEYFAG